MLSKLVLIIDKRKELLHNIVDEIKERLEDEKDEEGYNSILYL